MPIPFLVAGAVASAAFGAKKGYDAKKNMDKAKELNAKARRIFRRAKESLDNTRENTNTNIENLGSQKIDIYQSSFPRFIDSFSKITNIEFEDNIALENRQNHSYERFLDIKNRVLSINEVVSGGAGALAGGALAGFGAYGSVGMLATASTGTAIGSLSGAAATNATLAWLGGGSLASGGLGIAGGTAVLGGIVAGPILAVGGMLMASKSEESLDEARSNRNEARAVAEEMESAEVVLRGIDSRVSELSSVLKSVNSYFVEYTEKLESIVANGTDYSKYSQDDKMAVKATFDIANTLKNVCDAPLIDENGKVTQKSKEILEKAASVVDEIKAIRNGNL
jgi:hypothetical protein